MAAVVRVGDIDIDNGADNVGRQHGIAGVQRIQDLVVREGVAAGGKGHGTTGLFQPLVADVQQGGQGQSAAGGVAGNDDVLRFFAQA